MDVGSVLSELEALGTAQNRKIYARHGVREPLFGVSYAHLDRLEKRIHQNHALARALWASGNHDARILATRLADPGSISARDVDTWVKDLDNYVLTDAFSVLVAKSPHSRERLERWTAVEEEWVGTAGWNVLCQVASQDRALPETFFEPFLEQVERRIHASENRVRHAMNMALICIGIRTPGLRARALAAAERIGRVRVDHGETGCKTPDAAAYIAKVAAHRAGKAAASSANGKAPARPARKQAPARKAARKVGRKRAKKA